MQVREIIRKKLCTIRPDSSIREAAQLMRNENVGALPVLENGKGIGFVTDRDITIRAVAKGLGLDAKVREVMSPNCHVCDEDASLENAVQIMDKGHCRRLLVLDKKQKRPLGIVSLADIAAHSTKPDFVVTAVRDIKNYEKGLRA